MGDKGDKSAARSPEGCPAEAGGLFGPESALGFEHPSGTNARRPRQKAGSAPLNSGELWSTLRWRVFMEEGESNMWGVQQCRKKDVL